MDSIFSLQRAFRDTDFEDRATIGERSNIPVSSLNAQIIPHAHVEKIEDMSRKYLTDAQKRRLSELDRKCADMLAEGKQPGEDPDIMNAYDAIYGSNEYRLGEWHMTKHVSGYLKKTGKLSRTRMPN